LTVLQHLRELFGLGPSYEAADPGLNCAEGEELDVLIEALTEAVEDRHDAYARYQFEAGRTGLMAEELDALYEHLDEAGRAEDRARDALETFVRRVARR
jgi:hypothetical protein